MAFVEHAPAPVSGLSPSLAPGAVFGRYVLVEKIGRGAMGEVWVGLDPDLDRKVALKLLRADQSARPVDRKRLDAEARAMARLAHPNVVTIHDVGQLGEQLFIAMEFVDGETLDSWIARGPHPWTDVLPIMRQAAAGLAAAHRSGLVHRDFKPANVMIGSDGRVRVLDFGLARPEGSGSLLDGQAGDRSLTPADGQDAELIQGSPPYMSPEQHRGAPVDARSDLFSFCVTLFEALHGIRPFRGSNRVAVAIAVVEGQLVALPEFSRERVPDWIHATVLRGLASDPDQRFPDMEALLVALERSPEQRRRRRLEFAGATVGLVGLLGLGVALLPKRPLDPCDAAGEAITAQWSAHARASLRAQIDGVGGPHPLAGQRLIEGVDRYVGEWTEASKLVCSDGRAHRPTERLQSTREACLARHREAVGVLVRLASPEAEAEGEGDPAYLAGLAARPFAGLRALGDPSRCVDLAAAHDGRPLPDQDLRAAIIELSLGLAVLDAEQLSGGPLERLGQAPGVEQDLERGLLLGRVAGKRGDPSDGQARLHAVAAAATHAEPELAGRAWLALAELELDTWTPGQGERAAVDRAAQLLAYADASLPERDAASRGELGLLAGRLALLADDGPSELAALLEAAISRASDEPSPRAPDLLAAMLELRASLHERAGSSADASADRARAEQVRLAGFGR